MSRIAYYLRIWHLFYAIHRFVRRKNILVVFTYHRVTNREKTKDLCLNYDKGVDREIFGSQIKAVCEYFKIIGLNEFIEVLAGKKELKNDSALLTFDDADSDFRENAYLVLSRANCKAVIFVPAGFMGSNKRFWHLRFLNIMHNMSDSAWEEIRKNVESLPETIKQIVLSGSPSGEHEKSRICREIINGLDRLDHETIDNIINGWEEIVTEEYNLGIGCMGWGELKDLVESGLDVESHTVSHRKLAQLRRDEIIEELVDSKARIENELGKTVQAICYPAGSYNEEIIEIAAQSGYKVGFTTIPGVCRYPLDGNDLFEFPRLSIYGNNKYMIHLFIGKIAIRCILSDPR